MQVSCFTFHVLAGLASSNGCIELRTTVAGTDDDWFFDNGTQGFEDFGAECFQGWNEMLRNFVVDASCTCGWHLAAGDAEGFAKLVIELSQTDKTVLQEKGKNGRAYYDEHFTKDKCLRKLDEIMEL